MIDTEKLEKVIDIVDSEYSSDIVPVNNTKKQPRSNKEILEDTNLTSRQKLNEIGTNNLIDITTRSTEEQKRICQLGGKKSGESRRKRKQAKELLAEILARSMTDEQIEEILGNAANLLGQDKSAYNVMNVKALQCAMAGDTKAMQFIRDTVGDKPVEQIQQTTNLITEADKKELEELKKALAE